AARVLRRRAARRALHRAGRTAPETRVPVAPPTERRSPARGPATGIARRRAGRCQAWWRRPLRRLLAAPRGDPRGRRDRRERHADRSHGAAVATSGRNGRYVPRRTAARRPVIAGRLRVTARPNIRPGVRLPTRLAPSIL